MTDPNAPAPSAEWPPEKRLVYGTLSGIISGAILSIAKHFMGDSLPDYVVTGIPVLVMAFLSWFIPMTQREVANRLTNSIVKLAVEDPSNQMTAAGVARVAVEASSAPAKT